MRLIPIFILLALPFPSLAQIGSEGLDAFDGKVDSLIISAGKHNFQKVDVKIEWYETNHVPAKWKKIKTFTENISWKFLNDSIVVTNFMYGPFSRSITYGVIRGQKIYEYDTLAKKAVIHLPSSSIDSSDYKISIYHTLESDSSDYYNRIVENDGHYFNTGWKVRNDTIMSIWQWKKWGDTLETGKTLLRKSDSLTCSYSYENHISIDDYRTVEIDSSVYPFRSIDPFEISAFIFRRDENGMVKSMERTPDLVTSEPYIDFQKEVMTIRYRKPQMQSKH